MHEKRFNLEVDRLRDPDRISRLEVERVVNLSLQNLDNVQAVLDIGTGSGLFAEQFAAKGLQVTGLDSRAEMLPVAQKYVPSGVFREGVAEKLPFKDDSFDLVFMGLLLHETDNTLETLKEAYRVVRKRLAVLEWQYDEQSFGPPLEHRLSPDKIKVLAKQAGFKEVESVKMNSLVFYWMNIPD